MTGAADWTARVGQVWADEHARTERAFAGIAAVLDAGIRALAPASGHAVDIGCGVGSTALAIAAARPALRVTGVDLSSALVEVARRRAPASGPAFIVGDAGDVLPTLAPLDLLVSRHGVMFFADPLAAFRTMARAAAPDAPLVFSCFRARAENDWSCAVDRAIGVTPVAGGYAPGPYGLADRDVTADLLRGAGWRDLRAHAHDVRYVVGAGDDPVGDALGFFRRIGSAAAVLAAADAAGRARLEARLAEMLATRIRDGAVTFNAAIWLWSARAPARTGEEQA